MPSVMYIRIMIASPAFMSLGQMLFLPKYALAGAVNGIDPLAVKYCFTVTQFPFGSTLYCSRQVTI